MATVETGIANGVSFALTDEQKELRALAREFAEAELARWVTGPAEDLRRITWAPGARPAEDPDGHVVGLFDGQWALDYTREKNPSLAFHDTAPIGETVGIR